MSSSLYWAPPPQDREDHYLSLKYEIGRYFDKEYKGESIERTVGKELIPFLKGIMAVGDKSRCESAHELITAIEKHGEVEIFTRS